jgi:hypothetical protein
VTDERPLFDKPARRAERARIARLSRLPPLYEFSLQGRAQAITAVLVQVLLAIALGLVPVRLITGEWLPPGAALLVLVAAFALQAISRYLNGKAGRT